MVTAVNQKKQEIVVQKYGGSSVASVEMLKRVATKIVETRKRGNGVVVVISAMGNQTDELLNLARQISAQPSTRELDMLLSVGERIAMAVLSMAINDLGYQAISFTGSQSGIITDGSHTRARIVEVRAQRIMEELRKGKIVIVAGYQGVSREKEITTLGRGGSDTTSIALAAALSAERCEIYSDVDGIYTADPDMVEDAMKLDRISYEEMEDFSRAGAVVMKSEAVEYARRHKIKIMLMSSFRNSNGTTVGSEPAACDRQVLGLSSNTRLILIWGNDDESWSGRVRSEVVPGLSDDGFTPHCMNQITPGDGGEGSQLFMVFRNDGTADPAATIEGLKADFPLLKGHVRLCGSVTLITRDAGPFRKVFVSAVDLLRDGGHELIGYNTSDRCCTFYLPSREVNSALDLLHRELVREENDVL